MNRLKLTLMTLLAAQSMCAQQQSTDIYRQGIPTTLPMNTSTIEWQRTIYREIDLDKNINAGLGYIEDGENVFSRIFKLVLNGKIRAYEFSLNGYETFNAQSKIDIRKVMQDFHIPYSERDNRIIVASDNIPLDEVKMYYIKESYYYDLTNSMFRTMPVAICPVIVREDDYGDEITKYPMFWIEYKDIEPYFCDIDIYVGNNSWTSKMNLADYFVRNLYKGDIYKTGNLQSASLVEGLQSDSTLSVTRKNLELELRNVKKRTYNTFVDECHTKTIVNKAAAPKAQQKRNRKNNSTK